MINGIGRFKFTIPKWEGKVSYYLFAFLNSPKRKIEYMIISDEVLRARFQNQNLISTGGKKAELTLWMMQDRNIYDVTNITGGEGEWYMLSKSVGGRMADGTDIDYTGFLNNWKGVIDAVKCQ
jgi:hypothetical protein